jgi:hypothetical protein
VFPSVRFVPGNDTKPFSTTPDDPSGFEGAGFSHAQIDGLMEFIQSEYERIMSTAPDGMAELARVPSTVNVYSLRNDPVSAANPDIFKGCHKQILCPPRVTRKPDGKFCASMPCEHTLVGLALQCSPDDLTDQMKRESLQFITGHELVHLITRRGISSLMKSRLEALTDPIVQHVYQRSCSENSLTNIEEFGWDSESLQSTTGFAEPDCAMATYYPPAIMALYLATPHALRGIALESIWNIWKILMEESNSTGSFPLGNDIRSAILDVLQERSEQVLAHPCFRPLREGPNVCAISAKDHSCSVALPLLVKRIPSFGMDAQGNFQNTFAEVRPFANRVPYAQRLHDRTGNVLSQVRMNGMLGDVETWSYDTWLEKIRSSKHFPTLRKMMGPKMTFEVPGLKPITVVRSRNDPYNRNEVWQQMAARWVARGV